MAFGSNTFGSSYFGQNYATQTLVPVLPVSGHSGGGGSNSSGDSGKQNSLFLEQRKKRISEEDFEILQVCKAFLISYN